MARGQSHGLGFGNGSIIDYGDGMIEYRQTGKLLPAFKVNIADATGFSVRKATRQDRKNGASALQQMFVLQGSGTELAACPVNHGTAQKIEAWIRERRRNCSANRLVANLSVTLRTVPRRLAEQVANRLGSSIGARWRPVSQLRRPRPPERSALWLN